MMSVFEYAEDIKKSVDEVLKKCDLLDILVNGENDLLDEDAITMLDNAFADSLEDTTNLDNTDISDIEENIMDSSTIDIEESEKVKKFKKKNDNNNEYPPNKHSRLGGGVI